MSRFEATVVTLFGNDATVATNTLRVDRRESGLNLPHRGNIRANQPHAERDGHQRGKHQNPIFDAGADAHHRQSHRAAHYQQHDRGRRERGRVPGTAW